MEENIRPVPTQPALLHSQRRWARSLTPLRKINGEALVMRGRLWFFPQIAASFPQEVGSGGARMGEGEIQIPSLERPQIRSGPTPAPLAPCRGGACRTRL